eukprot:TRINITY_DN6178_c0_g1_i2.p1 TRINITY_DN6178_c0_g1~~TRINITY_DN6178_c0_g1_i2.p1  ORF type:complete len:481 (+),score=96.15 TRINITY_DN6178_c0_g1_i2:28-1470(+)
MNTNTPGRRSLKQVDPLKLPKFRNDVPTAGQSSLKTKQSRKSDISRGTQFLNEKDKVKYGTPSRKSVIKELKGSRGSLLTPNRKRKRDLFLDELKDSMSLTPKKRKLNKDDELPIYQKKVKISKSARSLKRQSEKTITQFKKEKKEEREALNSDKIVVSRTNAVFEKMEFSELVSSMFFMEAFSDNDCLAILSSFPFYGVDPLTVLSTLIEARVFDKRTHDSEYLISTKQRGIIFLKNWIKCCLGKELIDSEENLTKKFEEILTLLKENGFVSETKDLSVSYEKKLNRIKKPSSLNDRRASTARCDNIVLRILREGSIFPLINEHQYEVSDIAEQMTIIDNDYFRYVTNTDLTLMKWENDKTECQSINAIIERFNNMTSWVATEIICEPKVKQQRKKAKFFLQLAAKFREMRNFNGVFAIVASFDSFPLSKISESLIKGKSKSIKSSLSDLISSSNNYKLYRQELANNPDNLPTVPYLGL